MLISACSIWILTACSSGPTETLNDSDSGTQAPEIIGKPFPCHTPGTCGATDAFSMLDKNQDRFLSVKNELTAAHKGLTKADKNEDKKISIVEYLSYQDRDRPQTRVCISNSGPHPANWDLLDTRLNARDDGYVASMGEHPGFSSKKKTSRFVCAEVMDQPGPYTFRAEVNGQFCLVQLLTGDSMIDLRQEQGKLRCVPQRDGFHGTPAVSKEFPVDYANTKTKALVQGFPFREITLRNHHAQASFSIWIKNPQGKNFQIQLKPKSAYRVDLNTRVDEFYQPIQIEVRDASNQVLKTIFPKEQNLQCKPNIPEAWGFHQKCNSVLVGTYGFVSDLTLW